VRLATPGVFAVGYTLARSELALLATVVRTRPAVARSSAGKSKIREGDFFDGRLNLAVRGPPGLGQLDLLFRAGFQQLRSSQLGYPGQQGRIWDFTVGDGGDQLVAVGGAALGCGDGEYGPLRERGAGPGEQAIQDGPECALRPAG
jgi:hypothetical protein